MGGWLRQVTRLFGRGGDGVGGGACWCEHDASLRGDQRLRMKGTAALSLCLWPAACSCGRLCATRSFAYFWQGAPQGSARPGGEAPPPTLSPPLNHPHPASPPHHTPLCPKHPLKMEAKRRASKVDSRHMKTNTHTFTLHPLLSEKPPSHQHQFQLKIVNRKKNLMAALINSVEGF